MLASIDPRSELFTFVVMNSYRDDILEIMESNRFIAVRCNEYGYVSPDPNRRHYLPGELPLPDRLIFGYSDENQYSFDNNVIAVSGTFFQVPILVSVFLSIPRKLSPHGSLQVTRNTNLCSVSAGNDPACITEFLNRHFFGQDISRLIIALGELG